MQWYPYFVQSELKRPLSCLRKKRRPKTRDQRRLPFSISHDQLLLDECPFTGIYENGLYKNGILYFKNFQIDANVQLFYAGDDTYYFLYDLENSTLAQLKKDDVVISNGHVLDVHYFEHTSHNYIAVHFRIGDDVRRTTLTATMTFSTYEPIRATFILEDVSKQLINIPHMKPLLDAIYIFLKETPQHLAAKSPHTKLAFEALIIDVEKELSFLSDDEMYWNELSTWERSYYFTISTTMHWAYTMLSMMENNFTEKICTLKLSNH